MSESPKAKEVAEAILIVVKTVSKWVLLIVVGGGALFFGGLTLVDTISLKNRERERALVSASVVDQFEVASVTQDAIDSARTQTKKETQNKKESSPETDEVLTCVPWRPYEVTIKNNSKKTILKVDFRILVRKKGRSSVINDYERLSSDVILAPGESSISCWDASFLVSGADKTNKKELDRPHTVSVEVTDVTFEE